jgi:hypothetical protein
MGIHEGVEGDCKTVSWLLLGLSRAGMSFATTELVLDNEDRAGPPTCRTYRKDEEPEGAPEDDEQTTNEDTNAEHQKQYTSKRYRRQACTLSTKEKQEEMPNMVAGQNCYTVSSTTLDN